MRLIDADAFKEYCKEGLKETLPLFHDEKGRDFARQVTESFLKDIDEQPTIEQPDILTAIKTECEKHFETDECTECALRNYKCECILIDEMPCKWDIEEIRKRLADGIHK